MRTPFACLLGVLGLTLATAHAAFPPKGFVVHEGSESPDGHYAVLVPKYDTEPPEDDEIVSQVADLKARKVIGALKLAAYYAGANHRDLKVVWAPDSTWCVVEFDGRFAIASLSVVEIEHGSLRQVQIDRRVHEMLAEKLANRADGAVDSSTAFIRPGADRRLRLRVLADNNPKRFDDRKTKCALFQGTYDLAAQKWTITDARSVSEDQSDELMSAYRPLDPQGLVFNGEADRAKWLDDQLNAVYGALRLLLPPARFAAVKEEQVAWLKAQPKEASAKQRSAAWTARIKVLDQLLW
ncbi:MAG TPA: hypothetical protein VGO11_22685 [Chthoniobacteraceae bacterium]|jgi:uncharacterized protein YecT (DUF1311 family)|nr:hypothetical protein [Chthoniobacteraceae bacterium]